MTREHLIAPETVRSKTAQMERNILNFEDHELDESINIYRVMHIESLLEILSQRKLCLRQPAKWDDPFENYILKKCKNLRKLHFPADIFGQCWTLHPETDAMWRIYSSDKNSVKVKTTVEKLFSQLFFSAEVGRYPYNSCFIGKVKYVGSDEIKNLDEQVVKIVSGNGVSHNVPIAQTLLMKRIEFAHEAEVRLIFLDIEERKPESENWTLPSMMNDAVFEFGINTKLLIEEIVLDPRMNEYTCAAYENFIRSLGYEGPLFQSQLYKVE